MDPGGIKIGKFYATEAYGVVEVVRKFFWGSRSDPIPGWDVISMIGDQFITIPFQNDFLCEVHMKEKS